MKPFKTACIAWIVLFALATFWCPRHPVSGTRFTEDPRGHQFTARFTEMKLTAEGSIEDRFCIVMIAFGGAGLLWAYNKGAQK
ncbi:MAG TPA: hypothetical protein VMO00_18625 [Methylomirabilota bacterium]|nr:hypothetical protein [Methylomirabilota bacterium]